MNNSLKMFLLAAEELNFTRAAERAFVTQQCLSDHIKRLETSYNIKLFKRKPNIELTPEGQAMLRYASKIQALEVSMIQELSDIHEGIRGTIYFGISNNRGALIIPKFVPRFQEVFPNIDVQIMLDETRRLEPLLLNGKLDMFLGGDTIQHELFERTPIYEDPIYLIVSASLLKTYFPDSYEQTVQMFSHGADLSRFEHVPFVQGHMISTTTQATAQFLLKNHITLKTPISVSNFITMIELCRSGKYAAIAPSFHLLEVIRREQVGIHDGEKLHIFPIKGFDKKLNIEIITHRDAQPLRHRKVFINLLRESLLEENKKVQDYIAAQYS